MKILGTTQTGFIVEIGQHEMQRLTSFMDNDKPLNLGQSIDIHKVYSAVAASKMSALTLRRVGAEAMKAADEIEAVGTAVTDRPEQAS